MPGCLLDVVAPLSLAADAGHGVPLGHQLGASVLAVRAGEQLGLPEEVLRDCFDATLLDRLHSHRAGAVCPLVAPSERVASE